MNATTFELDLQANPEELAKLNSLLMPDASLLMGNDPRMTRILDHALASGASSDWHIISTGDMPTSQCMFMPIFERYARMGRDHQGIRLAATFYGAGRTDSRMIGAQKDPYRGVACVYTTEFWNQVTPSGYSPWGFFLETQLHIEVNDRMLAFENLELALALGARSRRERLAVVSPDPDSPLGYALRGFGFEKIIQVQPAELV